jgi:IclR family acetate operon transcriptional repressor
VPYLNAMSKTSQESESYRYVRSLERGLKVLLLFDEERTELSVREISAELNLSLATAYRIVNTLEEHGFLERRRSHVALRLGLRLAHLGWLAQSNLDIREVARPIMEELAHTVGETAVLMVPRHGYAVCVEKVEGSYPIRPRSVSIGDREPYHGGAVALAILAFLPEEQRERYLRGTLGAITPHTETDPDRLRQRCRDIALAGVAYSRDEVIVGSAAVAAPILGADRKTVLGAIGLTGLVERIVDLEDTVRDAAAAISPGSKVKGTPLATG